jgi:hypothetical protein
MKKFQVYGRKLKRYATMEGTKYFCNTRFPIGKEKLLNNNWV